MRKEGEADLANPNISEEEKRLIRRCLGLDDPGKAAESNRRDRVLKEANDDDAMPKPHIQGVMRRILIRRENKALRVTVETLACGHSKLAPPGETRETMRRCFLCREKEKA